MRCTKEKQRRRRKKTTTIDDDDENAKFVDVEYQNRVTLRKFKGAV